ncbi:CwfJ-like family protein [Euphorbia peplus]|nr:CwfJ-like family protein [Euphorbia peplus]
MLSGIKFIPRDQISNEDSGKKNKSSGRREKHRTSDSSDDDDLGRIKKKSGKKKKWYSSDEHSSEDATDSESQGSLESNDKKRKKKRTNKGKKRNSREKHYSDDSSSSEGKKSRKSGRKKSKEKGEKDEENVEIRRKEMGLDWMLRPAERTDRGPGVQSDDKPEEPPAENQINKANPRELNPYFKDNGSGYPDDAEEGRVGKEKLPSSSVVGDGGASWRMKALKRAQEQAAREGRKLDQVVEERWGSLGQLAVSAASHRAAPARAHLHAINSRKRGQSEGQEIGPDGQSERNVKKNADRGYLKDVSVRHPQMRAPKVHDSLSWGKPKRQNVSAKDADLISAAASSLNKFEDDGSFMSRIASQQNNDPAGSFSSSTNRDENVGSKLTSSEMDKPTESITRVNETLSANQLAAKALQLRMKGRHEEAEKLMQEAESIKGKQAAAENSSRPQHIGRSHMNVVQVPHISTRRKEDDADKNLAQKIMQNKQYSLSGRADDEYDFEDGPRKKSKKGAGNDHKSSDVSVLGRRILTQQERCMFCFENPNRPKHLVVSIANFTYLMLPQSQPVVPGHCCILTMQHESSTRTVDNNVWEEIRNFKKCLIMMFAKQEKEVIFLETVMGLSKQRRHCLIECIPVPQEIAGGAPLYFKKAIDEAEDEWSQHNAKKLIDTSEKGLRGSIPKDFPYFHVEFGLNKGFVHVIDDEQQFKSSLGLNVIRGMLELPEEDMYRRRRQESVEAQRQAVTNFAREWEPFDWTKQLD